MQFICQGSSAVGVASIVLWVITAMLIILVCVVVCRLVYVRVEYTDLLKTMRELSINHPQSQNVSELTEEQR